MAAALVFLLLNLGVGDSGVWRWREIIFRLCPHVCLQAYIYTNRHSKSRSQTCTGKHNLRYAQPYSTYAYPHRQRHTAVFTSRLLSYLFLHAALSLLTLLTSLPLIKEGNREEKIKCLRQDVRGCILQSEWNFFCSKSYLQITCSQCCKKGPAYMTHILLGRVRKKVFEGLGRHAQWVNYMFNEKNRETSVINYAPRILQRSIIILHYMPSWI